MWRIDQDHTGDKEFDATGRCSADYHTDKEHLLTKRFRVYDDDRELYYSGRSDDSDSEIAFEPLDRATTYAGATEIKYLEDGKWETL